MARPALSDCASLSCRSHTYLQGPTQIYTAHTCAQGTIRDFRKVQQSFMAGKREPVAACGWLWAAGAECSYKFATSFQSSCWGGLAVAGSRGRKSSVRGRLYTPRAFSGSRWRAERALTRRRLPPAVGSRGRGTVSPATSANRGSSFDSPRRYRRYPFK